MRLVRLATLAVVTTAACKFAADTGANNVTCQGTGAGVIVSASDARVFIPSAATIRMGQSVCWQEAGTQAHTATADNGSTFDGTVDEGDVYVHVFPDSGTFTYHCQFHVGMTGTITVTK